MIHIDKTRIVLIPSYEPREVLIDIVKKVKQVGFDVVVVDDGSGDKYSSIFFALIKYAYVISYPENQGKGHALKEGFKYIKKTYQGEFTVVTMDSDGQHSLSDVINVCAEAEIYSGSLSLGSRKQGKGSPLRSRFGNCITRNIYRLVAGLNVYDTQTGLRAFDKTLLPFLLEVPGERFEYEMNVLLEAARRKIPIREIAIKTIYIDGNSGSHFDKIKDSYRIYKEIIKFSLSSLAGFITDYIIYTLMMLISGNLVLSNIIARMISATVNYSINYKLVFKNKGNVLNSAVRYFILALCVLTGNTLFLKYITEHLLINPFAAKIITEIVFFIGSFLAQRTFVFGKREKNNEKTVK